MCRFVEGRIGLQNQPAGTPHCGQAYLRDAAASLCFMMVVGALSDKTCTNPDRH
jgi:hypothetical protein